MTSVLQANWGHLRVLACHEEAGEHGNQHVFEGATIQLFDLPLAQIKKIGSHKVIIAMNVSEGAQSLILALILDFLILLLSVIEIPVKHGD